MMTRNRNTQLSANSICTRVSSKPPNSSTEPEIGSHDGADSDSFMKVWVSSGFSKPRPWIGPLTMYLGRSSDQK